MADSKLVGSENKAEFAYTKAGEHTNALWKQYGFSNVATREELVKKLDGAISGMQ